MLLSFARARTDLSDFWRPRLFLDIVCPALAAGFYRVTVETHESVYCTLRLTLEGGPATPMTIFLDRLAPCRYGKVFSISRPVIGLELELEPRTDPRVLVSVEINATSLPEVFWSRGLLRRLATPRLLQKAWQVVSGRHSLAFSDRRASPVDQQSIYEAWQAAFESPAEQRRIEAALSGLTEGGPLELLMVYVSSSGAEEALRSMLSRISAECESVRALLLAVDVAEQPLPENLHAALVAQGGYVARCGTTHVPLQLLLEEAQRIGAGAFVYVERPGYWSKTAPIAFAVELLRHPDCLAVTSDSDQATPEGTRDRPQFKPGWSPRRQTETDYVNSAVAFSVTQQLADRCGPEADASSSRSLLRLLANEEVDSRCVRHIPRVLLHETLASEPRQRMPLFPAQPATIGSSPSISVIMPTRDNPRQLRAAARSVLDHSSGGAELVIVDNGASSRRQKAQLDRLSRENRVRIVRDPRPFNFSALVNAGRKACRGEVLVLLNDDVWAESPGWLEELARVAVQPKAGCVGALLLYPSGRIQHGGIVLGVFGVAGHAFRHLLPEPGAHGGCLESVHEVSAVTGACLAVRAAVFDAVGGFDEELPVTLNDVDFCLRVRDKGYSNLMAPRVRLVHQESTTRGLDAVPERAERLQREIAHFMIKWGHLVLSDPYYSPHLTLTREDFGPRDI